jgi:hypothetical protein
MLFFGIIYNQILGEIQLIFYNWERMAYLANGDPKNIILMVARLTYRLSCPSRNPQKSIFYKSNLNGDSYLLNPRLLLKNENTVSFKHMAEYVGLASYRRYNDYKMTNESTLLLYQNKMKIANIKTNPLLTIRDNKIHFKLEEIKNGN